MANKPKRTPKPRAPVLVPVQGKAAHNAAFLISIGNLVVNAANNESVFLKMLELLLGAGSQTAAIVWHAHRTARARTDLVGALCRQQIKDKALLNDIIKTIEKFHSLSRMRNFYCHATYHYNEDLNLVSATGISTSQGAEPLVFEKKAADRAMLNEMKQATIDFGKLNVELWLLASRLQHELRVPHELPPQ